MNKLEEKILNAINDNDVWLDNGDLMPFTLTSVIEDIAIEQMKGFAEWCSKLEYYQINAIHSQYNKLWFTESEMFKSEGITTDELILAYLKTLL